MRTVFSRIHPGVFRAKQIAVEPGSKVAIPATVAIISWRARARQKLELVAKPLSSRR
jgi:hypothetical protein